MNERYDVLVAGGGAAGLTAAAYCARAGLSTLLCEKGEKTGGLVHTIRYRGLRSTLAYARLKTPASSSPCSARWESTCRWCKTPSPSFMRPLDKLSVRESLRE